jgi:hypothetical protein
MCAMVVVVGDTVVSFCFCGCAWLLEGETRAKDRAIL